MAIEVTSLTELSQEAVANKRELLAQQLQETEPRVDLKRGVIHDLLLELSAVLAVATETNIDRVRRSNSLMAIDEDPALADPELVDKLLSNYGISRTEGSSAVGQITIIVNKLAPVTIEQTAKFEASGQLFSTNAAVIARTSQAAVQSTSDKVLTPLGNGNYAFTVSVFADVPGPAGRVKKDTLFVPTVTISNFVKAYAVSDFSGGVNTETNEELINRLQLGLSCKALSGRVNMYALLADRFPAVIASSVIGYGDAEMQRDQHSILPVSLGGRIDWYVKTAELPENIGITVSATLISKNVLDGSGIWQFSIDRDVAPGFYDVRNIRLTTQAEIAGSFEIVNQTRQFNLAPVTGLLTPDIVSGVEANYSRYQTAIVQFRDPITVTDTLQVGATQNYAVTLRAMPDIAAIQSSMGDRSTRHPAGDVLIKAAIPCFLSVSFTLEGKAGTQLPVATDIKTAIAQYVNRLGFVGRLYGAQLADIVQSFLPKGVAMHNLDILGKILKPDGKVITLRDSSLIVIPNIPEDMVSARTVCFVLDPENIAISARSVNTPD